jgi:hypothetical protein
MKRATTTKKMAAFLFIDPYRQSLCRGGVAFIPSTVLMEEPQAHAFGSRSRQFHVLADHDWGGMRSPRFKRPEPLPEREN